MLPSNQPEASEKKSFWNTTIGFITKITAFIAAVTALIIAIKSFSNNVSETKSTVIKQGETTIPGGKPTEPHVFTLLEIRDFLKAAEIGNVAGLKSDFDLGIKADITLNDDPATALVFAVNSNKSEAVKLLLEHGANPDIKFNSGSFPIIEASFGGYTEIVDLLIQHKANLNIRKLDGSGITALMFACIQGNKDIAQKLINAGADPNETSSPNNSTALDYANEKPSPLKDELVAILNSSGTKH